MRKTIEPISGIKARLSVPGSKSITHRALMLAALADDESEIQNPLVADDTTITADALVQMGVGIQWKPGSVLVAPPSKRWSQPSQPILLGNSGTSTRLLLALAATGVGDFTFDGAPRLRQRPVKPLVSALEMLGARFDCTETDGFLPLRVIARGLSGGRVLVDARQSGQFLSAVLMAAPCAGEEVTVEWLEPVASYPYVAMTLAMMGERGIDFRKDRANRVIVPAPQRYSGGRWTVEADCSSASYLWAAAALTGGDVLTHPLSPDSLQGDCRFLDILERMGCRVTWEEEGVRVVSSGELRPVDLDLNEMPDMVPTLAILAAFAGGVSRIRNVAHLRVKESDRLQAVSSELSKLGVPNRELPDGLEIRGGAATSPKVGIDPHDDHRIAMAFAVAGLRVGGVEIEDAEVVAKSFPTFWETFEKLKS